MNQSSTRRFDDPNTLAPPAVDLDPHVFADDLVVMDELTGSFTAYRSSISLA